MPPITSLRNISVAACGLREPEMVFDLQLSNRDVRLIDFDWAALTIEAHGRYTAELFNVFTAGDDRQAKALSRALEGIETAIALGRQLDVNSAERLLATVGTLMQSAAAFPGAPWLAFSLNAASEAAGYWASGHSVPRARHDDLRKWLRSCRLACEGHAIGADTHQQAAGKPAALN